MESNKTGKILFLLNGIQLNNGKPGISGGDIRAIKVSQKLTKYYDVIFFVSQNGRKFLESINAGLKSYYFNVGKSSGILGNLNLVFKSIFCIPKELKKQNIDIVYSCDEHLYDVLPALYFKIFKKSKWVAVNHWVADPPWKDKRGGTPVIIRYTYYFQRVLSELLIKKFSDIVLGVSDQTAEKLLSNRHFAKDKVKTVYCGVDAEYNRKIMENHTNKKNFDAVFMKRLNYGKGIMDLIEIWEYVCGVKKDAKLCIIGDGSDEVVKKVKEKINTAGLKNNIYLAGPVYDYKEKFELLCSSKLFILPSYEENWAIVIGEAMSVKIPVIAYNLKEILPIWQDNVTWIEKGNTKSFSQKILQFAEDESQYTDIVDRAFKFIQRYDWESIGKQEYKFINEI